MKVSVNTWVFGDDFPIEEALVEISEKGFKGVEINGRLAEIQWSANKRETVKNCAHDLGLEIVTVCADTALLRSNGKMNLTSCNPAYQEAGIRLSQEAIKLAEELGAKNVVLCSGKKDVGQTDEEAFNKTVESLQILADYAKERGVTILVENFPHLFIGPAPRLAKLIDKVNDDHVKALLDTGHEKIMGTPLDEAVKLFSEGQIGHIHLDNNNGEKDDHRALNDGVIQRNEFVEFLKILNERNYSGWYSFELYGPQYNRDPRKMLSESLAYFSVLIKEALC